MPNNSKISDGGRREAADGESGLRAAVASTKFAAGQAELLAGVHQRGQPPVSKFTSGFSSSKNSASQAECLD